MTYNSPVESTMFIEALSLCGMDDMFDSFRRAMPEDHLDVTTILVVVNAAMVFADVDRLQRFEALKYMQCFLAAVKDETGKSVSENWICNQEGAQ